MSANDSDATAEVPISSVVRFYAIVAFGLLTVLIVAALVYTYLQNRLSTTLFGIEWSTSVLANLVIFYFAFPAFSRTKKRSWLYIACAALIFASLALVTVFLDVIPREALRSGLFGRFVPWFTLVHYIGNAVGMLFYAYGVVSLARRA